MTDLSPIDSSWILVSAFLVLSMQIGFCMLEAGLVRQKNSINVAFKNLMDFVLSSLVFWAIGFGFLYGTSAGGLIGSDRFFVQHEDRVGAFFIYQMAFCGAAAAIVGGALAERTRLYAYLAIAALVAGLVYPVAGHWVWGGLLGGERGWLAERGFIDFAGGTVVHGVGGWLALAAALVIGPRIGRFDSEAPLRGGNYPVATVGVLVLWFGWFGFNGGSTLAFDERVPRIVLNTSLAAAAGAFALLAVAWVHSRKPDIGASLNGTISGLVGVTAGAPYFSTVDAVVVGAAAAGVCGLAARLLERWRVDDVIGAWPAHAIAGLVGTLLVAPLGDPSVFPNGHGMIEQLGVQALGATAIGAWAFGVGLLVLALANRVLPLRVSEADERIGLNIAEHDASTDLVELLGEMDRQRRAGDFTTPVVVEPHTEVGQIALSYNEVLERVRLEIETREEAYRQLGQATEFRFIFENTHEGIVQFDADGTIVRANPAAAALLGFVSPEDLIDKGGRWLVGLENLDKARHQRMVRALAQRGVARQVELSFTRLVDGRRANVQLDLRRVAPREGADPTALASIIDISERKANERLRVERDAANAASRAKSEFLANMSHEIRTPLNGVTGMLELLSRTELDDRQRRFVQIAGTSASALLSVINDILDVSKIEAGKLELERTAFTLPELLADVVDMFAPQAAGKGLELASLVPPTIPARVVGDPERLRQVLVNLVGNAMKFTERGIVTLRCECTRLGRDEAGLRIDVEDTGPGIDPLALERLFQPFTQVDGSSTRRHGGTGLGLTISRQLVELMGGHIGVDSEVGRGTVFHVDLTLPLAEPVDPAPDARGRKGRPRSDRALRVLAVDDHAVNLELVRGLLEPEGYEVACVASADAALAELACAADAGAPYHLALLDYHMPGTDGEQLARAIRADRAHDALRLVLLTSIDQAIDAAERARLRIHASITKPLRRSRLFDAIDDALTGVDRQDDAAAADDPNAAAERGKADARPAKGGKTGRSDAAPAEGGGARRAAVDGAEADADAANAKADANGAGANVKDAKADGRGADAKDAGADADREEADGAASAADADDAAEADARTTAAPEAADAGHDIPTVTALAGRMRPARGEGAASADGAPSSAAPRSLHVLVAEDNPVNQMVTEEILLAAGHVVMVADNGAEALERIENGDIELVLMDVQMPVMDGLEATRRLREREARDGGPRLPVIAVTANAVKGDRERCLEAGMDDYVAKPIDVAMLERAIERLTEIPEG